MAKTTFPDGIDERALNPARSSRPSTRFLILGALLAIAFLGLFGGGKSEVRVARSPVAEFRVETHDRLRNGNFFEVRFHAQARRPIADAVIAVPRDAWHDTTVNTMIPAPSEEEFVDGEYRLHFGPLDAGKSLSFKIDGQLNPPLFGRLGGEFRLLDGEAEIARVPATIWVIP